MKKCPSCQKSFCNLVGLSTHLRKHGIVLRDTNFWPLCKVCGKPASRISTSFCSQNHLYDFKKKIGVCIICGNHFKKIGNLNRVTCSISCRGKWLSKILSGRKLVLTNEQKENRSKNFVGMKNPFWGKKHTEETKRVLAEKTLANRVFSGQWRSIGKNEKEILDELERRKSIKILRQFPVGRFVVDGYDKTSNVVYEVYEPHHHKQVEKDLRRQKTIQEKLNCDFVVLYDNN